MNTENYEFHDVSNLFPMMDSESFESLKKDISANGLIEPIWLHEGKIIDGRNRYKACQEMAIDAAFRNWNGQGSLVGFVVSLNLNRRHLTPSQLAVVAHDIAPKLAEEAKERQRQAGKLYGENHPKQEVSAEMREALTPAKTSKQAAELVGASTRMVEHVNKIAKEAPEKLQEIRDGKVRVITVSNALPSAAPKPKQEEKRDVKANPFSNALQFSTIAISQLTRIRAEDPQRVAALMEVRDYIDSQLKTKGE